MLRLAFTAVLLITGGSFSFGQSAGDTPAPVDSITPSPPDSMAVTDSVDEPLAATINDSIKIMFPDVNPDTLSEVQRLHIEFETRFFLKKQDQEPVEIGDELSYFDSLVSYYVPSRWNLREDIDRSFYHDAGDYFKSDPGFFVLEPHLLPLRKTVQPYGLSGNRLGLMIAGRTLRPFEHIVEPDGLVDLNDVPTALDHTVVILPGPMGRLLGGDHSAATLLTLPKVPEGNNPESAFLVDKGGEGFSYARGRYSKRFVGGRRIDMSIGYRNSDGMIYGSDDDAYHYTGDFRFPVGVSWEVRADGWLYNRQGSFIVRPKAGVSRLDRSRFDRSARLLVSRHNGDRSAKYTLGYQHLRQGSSLGRAYRCNLNQTGHGLLISREWAAGAMVFRADLTADYLRYDNWHEKQARYSSEVSLGLARLAGPWGYAVDLRQSYVEDYRFLPSLTAVVRRETESAHLMASVGYSERAPSLNELYLPYQQATIYGSGAGYADGGNPGLISERQLLAAAELTLGKPAHSISVSVIGGRIRDGIDWNIQTDGGETVFRPLNGDIRLASLTAKAGCRLWDIITLKGGGSYHHLDYENFTDKAYSPEYQFFSGGELHLFWSQKLIDLYAYGEVVYSGPYDGYVQTDLGNAAVVNVKLSFRMGDFRFHWISQNALFLQYDTRDQFSNAYRFTSFGFTWDFFD